MCLAEAVAEATMALLLSPLTVVFGVARLTVWVWVLDPPVPIPAVSADLKPDPGVEIIAKCCIFRHHFNRI